MRALPHMYSGTAGAAAHPAFSKLSHNIFYPEFFHRKKAKNHIIDPQFVRGARVYSIRVGYTQFTKKQQQQKMHSHTFCCRSCEGRGCDLFVCIFSFASLHDARTTRVSPIFIRTDKKWCTKLSCAINEMCVIILKWMFFSHIIGCWFIVQLWCACIAISNFACASDREQNLAKQTHTQRK